VLGALAMLVPLLLFFSLVALCVWIARKWMDRPKT
jgi:hypothetical protein